jgi:hypothetical protein
MDNCAVYLHSSFCYRITDSILWGIPAAAYLQFFHNKEQDFQYSVANFDPKERIITKVDRKTIYEVTGISKEEQISIENNLEKFMVIAVNHLDEDTLSLFIKHENYTKFRTNPHWYANELKSRGLYNLLEEV